MGKSTGGFFSTPKDFNEDLLLSHTFHSIKETTVEEVIVSASGKVSRTMEKRSAGGIGSLLGGNAKVLYVVDLNFKLSILSCDLSTLKNERLPTEELLPKFRWY